MAKGPHRELIIRVKDVVVELKTNRILNGVTLDVYRGEILGFVGASGAGKSVLTRTIVGLLPKTKGRIEVFGVDLDQVDEVQRRAVERRWGILFQQGALFSSLTAGQNVEFPMREYLDLSESSHHRDGDHQIGNGRLETRCVPEISVRALRRHDQACCACPRPGA